MEQEALRILADTHQIKLTPQLEGLIASAIVQELESIAKQICFKCQRDDELVSVRSDWQHVYRYARGDGGIRESCFANPIRQRMQPK